MRAEGTAGPETVKCLLFPSGIDAATLQDLGKVESTLKSNTQLLSLCHSIRNITSFVMYPSCIF